MKLASKIALGLGGLTAGCAFLSFFVGGSHEEEIAERYGIPTSSEALKALCRVPAEDNAYGRYLAFQEAFNAESKAAQAEPELSVESVGSKEGVDPSKAQEYLRHFPKSLSAATELANRTKWFVDRDMSGGPAKTLFPEFAELKHAVRLLTLKAQLELSRGDSEGAFDSYARAAKIGSLSNSEPFMIGILAYMTCEEIVIRSIARSAPLIASDPAALHRAERILDSIQKPELGLAMKGESYFCYYSTKNGVPPEVANSHPSDSLMGGSWNLQVAWMNATGRIWGPTILREEGRAVESAQGNDYRRFESQGVLLNKWLDSPGFSQSVAGFLVPSIKGAGLHCQSLFAERDLVRLGLRSIAEGHKPDTSKTTDPFTGRPYKVVSLGRAWMVYSVGEDGIDGGGAVNLVQPDRTKDIVFRYDGQSFLIGR